MKALFVVVIVLFVLVIWGLIGSSQASEVGNTCDIGINDKGSVFCWKWHQNIIGDIQENFDELLNN